MPARLDHSARLRVALTLVMLAGAACPLAAQTALDEGTLVVSRGGAAVGRESFRIVQSAGEGALYTATAQVSAGERRLTTTLSADAQATALLYRLEARAAGKIAERIQAAARPGRFSATRQTPDGEGAKDYVVGGGAVVLDDEVYSQYALLPLGRRPGAVTVVVPRAGLQLAGRLANQGAETIEVDGRGVAATRWSLDVAGGAHDFWTDAKGRLLKVAIPSKGVVAVRDELPQ